MVCASPYGLGGFLRVSIFLYLKEVAPLAHEICVLQVKGGGKP